MGRKTFFLSPTVFAALKCKSGEIGKPRKCYSEFGSDQYSVSEEDAPALERHGARDKRLRFVITSRSAIFAPQFSVLFFPHMGGCFALIRFTGGNFG